MEQNKQEYFNSIIADIAKSFWDERGKGSTYRNLLVGVDSYLSSRTCEIDKIKDVNGAVLEAQRYFLEQGIVNNLEFRAREDFSEVLELNITGCVHEGMEKKLAKNNLKPLVCPCANVVMYLVEMVSDYTTELASIKNNGDKCEISVVFFKKPKNVDE